MSEAGDERSESQRVGTRIGANRPPRPYHSIAFAPFEGRNVTMRRVMRLEINRYEALQMLLFVVSSGLALALYGTRHTGKVKLWQDLELYAFYISWFSNLVLECVKILRARDGSSSGSAEDVRDGRGSSWFIGRATRLSSVIFLGWKRVGVNGSPLSAKDGEMNGREGSMKMEKVSGVGDVDTSGWNVVEYARRQNSGRDVYKSGWRDKWWWKKLGMGKGSSGVGGREEGASGGLGGEDEEEDEEGSGLGVGIGGNVGDEETMPTM